MLFLMNLIKSNKKMVFCFFKKLLFTMENATAAGSSQSNISTEFTFQKAK